jgi:hypothetical protein
VSELLSGSVEANLLLKKRLSPARLGPQLRKRANRCGSFLFFIDNRQIHGNSEQYNACAVYSVGKKSTRASDKQWALYRVSVKMLR